MSDLAEAQATESPPAPEPAPPKVMPLGARVAGAVLLLNAVGHVIELFVPGLNDPAPAGPLSSPVHILVDAAIGVALLRGQLKWQKIAVVRVLLGALVFSGAAAAKQDWLQAGTQLLFSGALLGLLAGAASRARIAASLVAASLMFLLEGVGLYAIATGNNPLGKSLMSMRDEIDAQPIDEIRGERAIWRLALPGHRWYLRKSAVANNALADRWLVDPAHDAHVIVIAEPVEAQVDADALANVVLDNARAAASDFRVVEPPAPLQNPVGPGRLSHTLATIKGIRVEGYQAVFVGKHVVYQVIGFGPASAFTRFSGDLQQIVRSFSL